MKAVEVWASVRAAAFGYANRGWRTFPCHSAIAGICSCLQEGCRQVGKHPLARHGFKDATTDPKTLSRWWTSWPHANVGIATGRASGLLVIDIDSGKGGDESLRSLEETHGPLPETPTVLTGGGGRHLYFRLPDRAVPSRVGIVTGVDVRGDGGYVIAPPSAHRSGRPYLWAVGFEIGEITLPEIPRWLLKLVETERAAASPRRDGMPLIIPEGERNDRLHRLGGAMRRWGLSAECLGECLMAINAHHCQPPLDFDEVVKIARSSGRYEPAVYRGRVFRPVPKP